MTCKECKGTGKYQPLVGPAENCQTCGGCVILPEDERPTTPGRTVYLPVYSDNEETEPSMMIPVSFPDTLSVYDTVHVFDYGWFEMEVVKFTYDSNGQRLAWCDYRSNISGCRDLRCSHICRNVIKNRWECIVSGTPT